MEMIKKLFCIILLIVVIVANVQICYAENIEYDFKYNTQNSNITNVSVSNQNQNSNINNLYTNNYSSIVSRYSKQLMHVDVNFEAFQNEFVYSSSNSYYFSEFRQYCVDNFSHEFVNNNTLNSLQATNIDSSGLTINYYFAQYSATTYSYYYQISGHLKFDMPLKNLQIENTNNASVLYWVSLALNLVDNTFTYANTTFTITGVYTGGMNDMKYSVTYSFDSPLSNVNGFYFFNEFNPFCNDTYYKNNFNFANTSNLVFNNSSYSIESSGNVSANSLFVNTLDKTRFNSCSYRVYKTNGQQSFGYTPQDQELMYLQLAFFTPIFWTNSTNFISSDSNGNITPLQLTYYDCEWYEIHLQLANAFIFMITEFPLLSDITNMIYSLFTMIKASFDVLLNFNGFGIIFAFGMFAIVFAFIYKLIVGD